MSEDAGAFLRAIETKLLEVERERPLLAFFQPERGTAWSAAAARALREEREPELGSLPPQGSDLRARRTLESCLLALGSCGDSPVVRLLVERVAELELDLRLIDARGTHRLREYSVRRYPFTESEIAGATLKAGAWSSLVPRREEALVSLADEFRRAARESGFDVRVSERDIVARAAVSAEGVVVRRGLRIGETVARRVVVHELEGHLFPRLRARSARVPLRIGMVTADADEEGRAVLLEERADLLDEARKRELAIRFRCASLCRAGASALESYRRLRSEGVDAETLEQVVPRVFRGGGLAREVVYLPALERIKRAFGERPEWETAFRAGRASVIGLREFERRDPGALREFLAHSAASSSITGA